MAQTQDREYRDPRDRKAVRVMREVWKGAAGYFPGHAMPVPRFGGDVPYGAVGFAKNPQGQPVPVGIRYDRGSARDLSSKDPAIRDEALRTLLHEWAHNFQNPSTYADGNTRRRHRILEGGAEAFAFAAAPKIAAAIGHKYKAGHDAGLSMRYSEYRRAARQVTRGRGMGYVMRGQFG